MEKHHPVEIPIRLAAHGRKTESLEDVEAMREPVETLRLALLDPRVEAREDQMAELHTIGCF